MEMEFSTPKAPKVFDSMNDDDSDIEFFISTSNNKENIKNQETASCNTETIARKLKCNKTTNKEIDNFFTEKSPKTQFKGIYLIGDLCYLIGDHNASVTFYIFM